MLQQPEASDYVLATGEEHTVRDFVELSFEHVGRRVEWRGAGVDETGLDAETGQTLVVVDPRYFRPTEVDQLLGDAAKAKRELGWTPTVAFRDLVREMVEADVKAEAAHPAPRS